MIQVILVLTEFTSAYKWRQNFFRKSIYRKSSIRSRPCIILNPKFPRLVLEVFQKLQFLEQNFLSEAAHKGPNRVILKDLNFCQ